MAQIGSTPLDSRVPQLGVAPLHAPPAEAADQSHFPLHDVVNTLCSLQDAVSLPGRGQQRRRLMPSRAALEEIVTSLRAVLFPGYYSHWDLSDDSLRYYVGATIDRVAHGLQAQIKRALCLECESDPSTHHPCDEQAAAITSQFIAALPEVRRILGTDVTAAFEGDPAARSHAEVIFSYPSLVAITVHRLAHVLYELDAPLIPRIISECSHSATGIDIHPGARIGERFFIDHGTGVVIGETAELGTNVRIYQGVTLGAKSFPLDPDGNPIKGVMRHPCLEDDVTIYAGATILGRITIGRGAVIGGNVWVTKDVPAGAVVTQTQPRQMRFDQGAGI